jgi:hypothetical protein
MSLVQPNWKPCSRRKLDPMIDGLFNENTLKVVETFGKIDDVATGKNYLLGRNFWTNFRSNCPKMFCCRF